MVESDVKSAEAVADSLKTDKAFIVLKNDGTLWLTDTNKKEKIADNLKGFRYYKYYYGSDTNVRNEYMYLDYNGELFFMPDYKSGKREIIMEDVKNFASDKFDYWSQHMFVEKNDESLWVMGYNYGSLGMGKAGRDVKIPSQNLYNVESVETTTEITDINLDELHKEEIPLRGALLALTVVVLGGIILWIAKRR